MDFIKELLPPALVFIGLGALMGILLAVASKVFKVEKDEKAEQIGELLPGRRDHGEQGHDVVLLDRQLFRDQIS